MRSRVSTVVVSSASATRLQAVLASSLVHLPRGRARDHLPRLPLGSQRLRFEAGLLECGPNRCGSRRRSDAPTNPLKVRAALRISRGELRGSGSPGSPH